MRRAVVTGSRGGIGAAAVAALESAGYAVTGVEAEDDAAAVFAGLAGLDALVCAHGGSGRAFGDGPVDVCTDEGWERTLDLNLGSVFRYCRLAIPLLRANGGGAVVTVSSALALAPDAEFSTHAYVAAKGALIALTRAMAVTYAPDRIRCNVVCPGLIATPMSRRAQADERVRARLPELQPLTADFGRPEDVAGAIAYLVEAEFTTGAVLSVDGGWAAR
jgi:NAD(P)-dependent dehydrogenase (short-subunit alcohol dehydrogenase family)